MDDQNDRPEAQTAEADGIEKHGIEMPVDGVERTVTLAGWLEGGE